MKKWQELSFNFLFNVAVALIAGGILKLVFDKDSVLSGFLVFVAGVYFGIIMIFLAKFTEEKEKNKGGENGICR